LKQGGFFPTENEGGNKAKKMVNPMVFGYEKLHHEKNQFSEEKNRGVDCWIVK